MYTLQLAANDPSSFTAPLAVLDRWIAEHDFDRWPSLWQHPLREGEYTTPQLHHLPADSKYVLQLGLPVDADQLLHVMLPGLRRAKAAEPKVDLIVLESPKSENALWYTYPAERPKAELATDLTRLVTV